MRASSHVAEIAYFIAPIKGAKGRAKAMLAILLARISLQNELSLTFHKKNGFLVCGRFLNIGLRFGQDFNVV
jgi:L-amino acid N-acyltransferase YncA